MSPWCGWYVSTDITTGIALVPVEEEVTEYTGVAIAIAETASQNTAYVGPTSGLTTKGAEADCSWFTAGSKYGARYDVVADGNTFVASAILLGTPTVDSAMDFYATTDVNPLNITNIGIESCSLEGFVADATAALSGTGDSLTTTPWTVLTAAVLNNNFCQWSAKYEINIPAGLTPTYGGVTYRWAGPTLTHTLVIPEVDEE